MNAQFELACLGILPMTMEAKKKGIINLIVPKEEKSDILETISIMELTGKIINVGGIFKKQ